MEKPDTTSCQLEPAASHKRLRLSDWAVITISTIMAFAALRAGQAIFAPVLLAFVFGIILSPLSDAWNRTGLPKLLGAFVTFVVSIAVLDVLVVALEPLAQNLIDMAPRLWADLRDVMGQLRDVLTRVEQLTEDVVKTVNPDGADTSDAENMPLPTLGDALILAPGYAAQVLIFVGTLFFFLLGRDELYAWVAFVIGPDSQTNDIAERLRQAETMVSRYFLTVLVVNIGFGAVVAGCLSLIGLPSALTWGLVATLMNFLLYLGPAMVAVALMLTGIAVFDGTAALLPPLVFLGCNVIESQFVTPGFVGRQVSVSPLLVFLALVFWLWLWGPIGGFVAIPLLLWVMAMTRWPDTRLAGPDQTISSGTPGTTRPNRRAG
jgi:predicted PurR-regulated permease PerM